MGLIFRLSSQPQLSVVKFLSPNLLQLSVVLLLLDLDLLCGRVSGLGLLSVALLRVAVELVWVCSLLRCCVLLPVELALLLVVPLTLAMFWSLRSPLRCCSLCSPLRCCSSLCSPLRCCLVVSHRQCIYALAIRPLSSLSSASCWDIATMLLEPECAKDKEEEAEEDVRACASMRACVRACVCVCVL